MVEDPSCAGRQVGGRAGLEQRPVDIPADRLRLPLDREDVKIVRERPPPAFVNAAPIAWPPENPGP